VENLALSLHKSLKDKKWVLPEISPQLVQDFVRFGCTEFEARLMINRGIEASGAQDILNPKLSKMMPDPMVLSGMQQAVDTIIEAIESKRKITIFADYDVDGGTSAAILTQWFKSIGATPNIFVPDRIIHGYGPSPALMRGIKEAGTELLISVDCGAAAHDALITAREIGLDVVVFDHHLMIGDAPLAAAIVNPNQHGDNSGLGNLTAAGVCFMAVVALGRAWRDLGRNTGDFEALSLLDLAALGTICDVAPLIGLNRVLVAQGQKVLGKQSRKGLKALAQVAGLKRADNVYAAAWVLGPRINAGGRIGDSSLAVRLLTTDDENEAKLLALELETINAERKTIEAMVLEDAIARIERGEGGDLSGPLLLVGRAGWHPGVLGIVAGRLKERYNRPCIVIGSIDENDTVAKGSGRSIDGVNLGAIVKKAASDGVIISGGGHAMAAGLVMEFGNWQSVYNAMCAGIGNQTQDAITSQSDDVDAIISAESIAAPLLEAVERLAPYGAGWPEPRFCIAEAKIVSINIMKGAHLRVTFKDHSEALVRAVCFGAVGTKLGDALQSKRLVNLIVRIKKDEWRGTNAVETEIIDAAFSITN
jgi:single-stranded-DNA-specific exonuclease